MLATLRPSKFPEIEAELVQWLTNCKKAKKPLTDALIRNKAKEVAKSMQIPEDKFKASSGWVENFKQRHGIRNGYYYADGRLKKLERAVGNHIHLSPRTSKQRLALTDHIMKHDLYDVNAILTPCRSQWAVASPEALTRQHHKLLSAHVSEEEEDGDDDEPEDDDDQAMEASQLDASASSGPAASTSAAPAAQSDNHHPSHAQVNTAVAADTSLSSASTLSTHSSEHLPIEGIMHGVAHEGTGSHQQQEHADVAMHAALPDEPRTGDPSFSFSMYQPAHMVHSGNARPPSVAEADESINKLLLFLDAQPAGFVTHDQREILLSIKRSMFSFKYMV